MAKTQTLTYEQAIAELRALQRKRSVLIKSRIMIDNASVANVACALGYTSSMEPADRLEYFERARGVIAGVLDGTEESEYKGLIVGSQTAIDSYHQQEKHVEKQMTAIVKALPIAPWVAAQKGLGLLSVGKIIGEAGDLLLYPAPGKLWKRFGLSPYTKDGVTQAGSTWRKKGGLNAEDWEKFGYAPHRRSITYVISESLIKAGETVYRQRYNEARARFDALHPDSPKKRSHLHGMLCMVKLAIKNLWIEWHRIHGVNQTSQAQDGAATSGISRTCEVC